MLKKKRISWSTQLAFLFILIMMTAFFVVPVLMAAKQGFYYQGKFSFYWLSTIIKEPVLLKSLINSFVLAISTTVISIIISLPMAIASSKYNFRFKTLYNALMLAPLILPPFVGAMSVKRFLAQYGILNRFLIETGIIEYGQAYDWLGAGFSAVVLLQVLHLFPIMYLNLSSALANMDPAMVEASNNLGAGRWRTLLKVVIPLLSPGIFAGSSLVFIWSFTDIGTPLIFNYNDLAPIKIFTELKMANIDGSAYGFVIILLVVSLLLYITSKFMVKKTVASESGKASRAAIIDKLSLKGAMGVHLLFLSVLIMAILPHIGVILIAFSKDWVNTILPQHFTAKFFLQAFTDEQTRTSILNSVKYASCSTILDLVIGITAAWLIIRKKHIGAKILDGVLMLPLAIPGLIMAAGYVMLTAFGTPLEKFGPGFNPFIIIVIAYAVRRLPFVVRGVSSGLEQIPETLEQSAVNLGASKFAAFTKVTLPLVTANIIAASVLAFSFAMLEVSDSLILAQQEAHYPITKQMYAVTLDSDADAASLAAALGVVGMLIMGGAIGIASCLLGKKLGAIFRA